MQLVKINLGDIRITEDKSAIEERQTSLAELEQVTQINSAAEQDVAVRRCKRAKILIKDAEKSRKAFVSEIKEKLTDRINERAKEFIGDIQAHIDRIGTMLVGFQIKEDERLAEAERVRLEAIAKAEAERKKAEAEAQREEERKRELAEKVSQGKLSDREASIMAELDQQEAADKVKETTKAAEVAILAKPAERQRGSGQRVEDAVCYEVTDIAELYKARPDLVRLEPNARAIRDIVTKDTKIPGLRVWVEKRSIVVA